MYGELFGQPFVPGSRIAVHKCQVAHGGESESIIKRAWQPLKNSEMVTFSFSLPVDEMLRYK
jgi:hypothetical protein